MSRHPEVKWAQREDKVYVTVMLPDAKNPKVNLEPEGVFTFTATAGAENHPYEFKLELNGKVNVEESKINVGVRNIFCVLEKEEKEWWNKLLRGEGKTPHYVKVDWDKWVDEDEDDGPPAEPDLGGMDFSKFGDMGGMGMPGMGGMGMPGMGGMGMPGMGGMGMPGMGGMGMPGMGGMGMPGMGGMGMPDLASMGMGMGDDALGNDFEDSDDEEQVANPEETASETIDAKPKVEGAEGKVEASQSS